MPPRGAGSRLGPRCPAWSDGPLSRTFCPARTDPFGAGLFVDLVPSSCWFTNVRSCVDVRDWDRLRRRVYGRAGQRCEVCGAEPDHDRDVRLEAHERWDFLETPRVQKLIRLICLCNQCHEVTHFGFAQVQGTDQRALAHLMTVGGLSRRQAEEHVQRAFRTWEARSRATWTLDLSMLTDAGVRIVEPPSPGQRREASRDMLARETPAQTKPAPAPAPATRTTERAAGPGWFPDPAGRYPLRWWNGSTWTKWVAHADRSAVADPTFRRP